MIERLTPEVTVVGTAHIAAQSVAEVEEAIRAGRPSKVLVELDAKRHEALRDPEAWQRTDIIQVIKQGKQHLFLLQLYLAAMQARMGRDTGVAPGQEMLKAMQVAEEVGAEVVLIDRDVGLTLKRGFGSMGFWQKSSLLVNVLMEVLPSSPVQERPESTRRRLGMALVALGVAAVLLAVPSLRADVFGLVGRALDAVIGFPSLPLLTITLAAAVLGALAASMVPLEGGRRPLLGTWEPGRVAWAGLAAVAVAAWGWRFVAGLGPAGPLAGLGSLVRAPALVAAAVAAGAVAWGAWAGIRLTWGARRFARRRRTVVVAQDLDMEALLQTDAITAMTEEFAAFAPRIKHALIDERDAYMASHILEHAASGPVVAVVGAGHMAGIRRQVLAGRPDQERHELDQPPRRRFSVARLLGYAVPAAILGVFVYLGVTGQFIALRRGIVVWVVYNGTLAALGAMLARGHVLSVLTAFVAAPLTSLNPLLAAGWFAGAVEAKVRTPTVADFEAIRTVETVRQFTQNGVVRVLMVTALANLGSSIGTWVAGWKIFQSLAVAGGLW